MSILNQKTINANVTFEGVGLHGGNPNKFFLENQKKYLGLANQRVFRGPSSFARRNGSLTLTS